MSEFDKRRVLQSWLSHLFGETRSLDFEACINGKN